MSLASLPPVVSNYVACADYLDSFYDSVCGYDFYRDLFPDNECRGELCSDFSKPNAVYLYKASEKDSRLKRRIMLDDTWESDYMTYVEYSSMALCGGLSYTGRTNKLAHAHRMHALIFDIDGVSRRNLEAFFYRTQLEKEKNVFALPVPTYVVLSGTGMHVYYVFDKPIDLYPNIKLQLKELKYYLTRKLWDYDSTSQLKSVQYQSINQGFRMVGSINSKYNLEVIAFKTGDKISLEYLNSYAREECRVDITKRFNTKYSLSEAQENFPEWYQRVIVDRQKSIGKWTVKEDLYNWWLKEAQKAVGGHRYYTLLACVMYADKCCIPKDRLRRDLDAVFDVLKKKEHVNPLTEDDLNSAFEMYGTGCHTTPIAYIERITGIPIKRNRRNYRERYLHLRLARSARDILCIEKGKSCWWEGNGRPDKREIVQNWRKDNPAGKKIDCERQTGLSRPTVLKWWNTSE